jgi:hypothetical protein
MRSRSSRASAWIPPEILILAGAGAFAALGKGRWITLIGDHGLWYSELQGLLCGGHLMHEVRVPYGPISMWLIWLAARVFGPTISTVAGFVFVAGLAAVVLIASFSRAFLSRSEQWCCAALLVVVILWSPGVGNLLYPYAFAIGPGMVFALAALFAQRAALSRESLPLAAVAGALAATAFLTKQETGAFGAGGIAILSLMAPGMAPRKRLAALGIAGASFCATWLAILRAFLRGHRLMDVAGDNHLWPLAPLPPAIRDLLWRMQGFDRSEGLLWDMADALAFVLLAAALLRLLLVGRRLSRLSLARLGASLAVLGVYSAIRWAAGGHVRVLVLALPALLVSAAVAGLEAWRMPALRKPAASYLALAAGALLLLYREGYQGLSDSVYSGIGFAVTIPVLTLFVAGLARTLPRGSVVEGRRELRWMAVAIVAVLILRLGAQRLAALSAYWKSTVAYPTLRGTAFLPERDVGLYREAARAIETRTHRGDPILLLPETQAIDFILDRRNTSFFPNLVPGILTPEGESELIESWRLRPPRIVFCVEGTLGRYRSGQLGHGFAMELMKWVGENYPVVLRETIPGGQAITIYLPDR